MMHAKTKPKQNLTNVKQRKARWGKGARSPLAEKRVTSVTRVTREHMTDRETLVVTVANIIRIGLLLKQTPEELAELIVEGMEK